jgi:exodeoxyribonuclease V alpha subunit
MNEDAKLIADFLIVDECSMLDISLTASLLKAVPPTCQVLFIGDPDQLPAVGAGNVLKDMIASGVIPCFRLTQVFRQAQASLIIQYAHQINKGQTPAIESPFKNPDIWKTSADCLFIDSDEATQEQLGFITRVKRHFDWKTQELENLVAENANQSPFEFRIEEAIKSGYEVEFVVPDKFKHVMR